MLRYLIVVLFLSTVFAVDHNCQQDESIVDTQNGCISGLVEDTVRRFLSIPFAEPPIGSLRWADPVAVTDWYPNVLQATTESPACPQNCALPPGLCPTQTAEDCLYLDVVTPRASNSQNSWPVMVFIAGGAYEQSSPFVPLYDADFIANYTNTVVVLIAYRLGALGFLVTDELNGNYGIKDQRLALQWINNNIANFGGDVSSITIFGESAGAGSVGVHLMSPKSSNLFDKAIMESNPLALPFKPNSEAAKYGAKLASDLGCETDDLNCLRGVSVDSIVSVQDNIFVIPDPLRTNLLDIVLSWAPTIDGDEVTAQPVTAFQQGDYDQSKPVLIGTNSNEAVMFIYGFLSPLIGNGTMASWEYDLLLAAIYDLSADDVHSYYPPSSEDARISLSTLMTDYLFVCPSRNVAASISQHGTVFEYNFNHSLSFDAWGPDFQFCDPYACHGAELPFVFHTPLAKFDNDEELLSVDMVIYWANFARNGDPSVGMPVSLKWPAYNPSSNTNMEFVTPYAQIQTDYRKKYCDFWDSLGYAF